MSDINKMDFKQLRNEVQLLRDELAIMKRKYEDIIYNLDDSNFSGQFIKEKNDMKTKIEVTAEGIKTMVSKTDLENSLSDYSTISQTATKIESAVRSVNNATDEKLENYSTISQTAEEVRTRVAEEIVDLEYSVSEAIQTATGFETRVSDLENFKTSTFTQNADGFTLDGNKTTFTGCLYLTDNNKEKAFSIFLNESDNYDSFHMWGFGDYEHAPIIIGNSTSDVYLSNYTPQNMVATQGWVLENAGSGGGSGGVAVFG